MNRVELDRLAAEMRLHFLTTGSGCWMRALPALERKRRARWAAKIRWRWLPMPIHVLLNRPAHRTKAPQLIEVIRKGI